MKRAAAIVVLAIVAVISLRAVLAGRGALADGDDWMLRGKPREAIRSYEAAARWYVPLAPHVDAAYAKLRGLTGDTPTGLLAWRAIRSAARATRTLWQPHAADLAAADAAIARLAAQDPEGGEGRTIAWHDARLSEDLRANRGAAVLAGLGIAILTRRCRVARSPASPGARSRGGDRRRPVCWLVGLYNA